MADVLTMEVLLAFHGSEKYHRYRYQALYHALREILRQGDFLETDRLPSIRELADTCGLSLNTVVQVYEMLCADGYLRTEDRRGFYISHEADDEFAGQSSVQSRPTPGAAAERVSFPNEPDLRNVIDFNLALSDLRYFPQREWMQTMRQALNEINYLTPNGDIEIVSEQGLPELRRRIALHLRQTRGLAVSGDQILVTAGTPQSLVMLFHVLLEHGEAVMVEDPTHPAVREAILLAGGAVFPVAMDADGLRFETNWPGRIVSVTPDSHFPTGFVLSPTRRRELADWIEKKKTLS